MNSPLTTDPNRIIIYVRVSTQEQEDNHSLKNQISHAIEYCINNELILPNEEIPEKNIYREVWSASEISNTSNSNRSFLEGDFTTRPKLKKILQLAYEKKFDHFVVYNRDRFSRSTNEFFAINLIFNKQKIKVHYTKPGELQNIDNDPLNSFYNIIMSNLSEYEAEMISTRVKSITKEAVKSGYWPGGNAPYGYKIVGKDIKKRKLEIFNSYRAGKIKEIFHFYTYNGYGYKKIANLMKDKYPNENWTRSKVESIIRNETYTGKIVWNRRGGRRRPGKHEDSDIVSSQIDSDLSLVSPTLWPHILELRESKHKCKDSKYYNTPYILRGKLKCGICNEYMEAKDYGKGKRKVYRCTTKKDSISELIIDKDQVEDLFFSNLDSIFKVEKLEPIWLKYQRLISNMKEDLRSSKKDVEKNVKKVEELRSKISSTLKLEIDESLKTFMITQDMKLKDETLFWQEEYKALENKVIREFSSMLEFKEAIEKIINEFSKQSIENKRMLIDFLVDEIVINNVDNKIEMDITLNPSQQLCPV